MSSRNVGDGVAAEEERRLRCRDEYRLAYHVNVPIQFRHGFLPRLPGASYPFYARLLGHVFSDKRVTLVEKALMLKRAVGDLI